MSLWTCPVCSKPFSRKGDLTRHEQLHTGVRPHACPTCGKRFAQLSALKTHLNVHTKDKPYRCGIGTCKKAFGDPSSCARHRKEFHNRERAFQCFIDNCGTRIKRRSAFLAHLRRHGLDPTSLDIDAQSSRETSTSTDSASASVGNDNRNAQPRSMPPSFISDNSGYYPPTNSGEASYLTNEWLKDSPFDARQADLFPPNDLLLPTPDQANIGTDILHSLDPYLSNNIEDPLFFDTLLPSMIDYSYITASPLNLPILEPFLEAGFDAFQSSSSTPSSTYSTLY